MKLIFILLILSSILSAIPTIEIDTNNTKLKEFKLEYFVDKTESMTLKEVQTQIFRPDKSTLSLGIFQDIAWVRFQLHNSTNTEQKLYIHNENGYISNEIDFYELQDNKLINSLSIVLRNSNDTEHKMYATDAIFTIVLDVNQTKTIYIKSTMIVMQYPYFTIFSEDNSKRRLTHNNSLLFIILGMLIALTLYHTLLYTTTRYKEYLYYSLYLLSATIWEAFLSGMLANNFGIYFTDMSEYFLLSVLFIPIFLVLFAKSIFETQKNYKRENRYLNSVLILFGFAFIFGTFNLYGALIIASPLYAYMFLILFITTYSIMKKGNPLALTFLIANTIFSLFMMITNLYYMGLINYTLFTFNAASIGVVTEAIILSLLLSYKIKLLQKSQRNKDKILFGQQKLVRMGEMIENIAHQWRQPLSQINSSVLVIDNYLDPKHKDYEKVESKLLEIEKVTMYMSKTIDSFKNFFEPNKLHSTFSIEKVIKASLLILKSSIAKNSITVEYQGDKNSNYFGLEDELQQVLIIILNNAKDALLEKKTINAKIIIQITLKQDSYLITISDNAGGIQEGLLDKIFEPYFTTKHKSQGTGLGLYIAKLIIEDNMFGSLSVRNGNSGALFEIELPLKNSNSI